MTSLQVPGGIRQEDSDAEASELKERTEAVRILGAVALDQTKLLGIWDPARSLLCTQPLERIGEVFASPAQKRKTIATNS